MCYLTDVFFGDLVLGSDPIEHEAHALERHVGARRDEHLGFGDLDRPVPLRTQPHVLNYK